MRRASTARQGAARFLPLLAAGVVAVSFGAVACAPSASRAEKAGALPAPAAAATQASVSVADAAPPAAQTAGFDGAKAFEYLKAQVAFGPRPAGSPALARTQDYIKSQLTSFGCKVEEDDFTAQTPIGPLRMKNILVKENPANADVVMLLTHYDTVRIDNFVGANDAASSTAVAMELARLYCGKIVSVLPRTALWIAFLDGEEAQKVVNGAAQWTAEDSVYGSRQLAARMAVSGDLKRVKAVVLIDMIGDRDLRIARDRGSSVWITDVIWSTAKRLGYGKNFPDEMQGPVSDDHEPFTRRGVAAIDMIDFESASSFWHTPQDTVDKVTPRSLAIVGHVLIESLPLIEKHSR